MRNDFPVPPSPLRNISSCEPLPTSDPVAAAPPVGVVVGGVEGVGVGVVEVVVVGRVVSNALFTIKNASSCFSLRFFTFSMSSAVYASWLSVLIVAVGLRAM